MRKWNALISMGILVLFLIHAVAGALQMAGFLSGGSAVMGIMAWVMLALIALHVIIGCKLTADTLRSIKKSGVSYPKENRLFWVRRISGFAVMAFIVCHLLIFMGNERDGVVRLHPFEGVQLVTQILLVLSIAVHVLTNIRPLMIALGERKFQKLLLDALIVLAGLLLAAGVGFVIYFIRWNAV